ncbi:hypothetical protein A7317_26840 [Pseudomonas fluorescens]|uniref:hypothetical protein n=1 Tax=Pseudomonas fluorescens TaxID=294 RepID=UPI00083CDC6D|nr:hypothetical protein [Pseudomonas fluorescens]AOE70489.1 hypothetical protein A7317_26840 [Pseudomonas fluorescens]AOE76263.1 hypothetical protein A7319_26610 [Pseudomonas fluorescens]
MTVFMNSSSIQFSAPRQLTDTSASAPGLVSKLIRLLADKTISTAPPIKQGAIFLIDGHPVLISTSALKLEEAAAEKAEAIGLTAQLDAIKDFLGLTVTQLSELFKVTRKTVYDWYDGADPRPVVANKINALYHVFRSMAAQVDLKRLKQVWNLPVNGESLIEAINSSTDQHHLEAALADKIGTLAHRMAPPTRRSATRSRDLINSDLDGIIRDAAISR